MEKIISINNLSISFNKYTDVVKNVTIDVVKGKTTAIVGESGSGKTLSALSILKSVSYTHLTLPTIYSV